jgi:divalent metal cation (Fe/Co/Zn/Cd) transporter
LGLAGPSGGLAVSEPRNREAEYFALRLSAAIRSRARSRKGGSVKPKPFWEGRRPGKEGHTSTSRESLLRRALLLEGLTVTWNIIEGIIAVAAGVAAGSVALVSFGIDSFIETTSAAVVGWRLQLELRNRNPEQAREVEYRATRVAALLLLLLAIYIVGDAGRRLLGLGVAAAESVPGIILTAVSLVVMPLLAWAKFSTAAALGSRALRTDAFETVTCVWLSLATLGGLVLTATLEWTWADPLAALLLLPVVVREGLEGLRRRCD